ncbi:aldo/keto reductase, partial [Petrachloros mirabilis]
SKALQMVTKTLDAMSSGGIYDHIGGGFARYSTDERWLVPHFEKMLYDNALLARTYLEAYQVTKDLSYRRVVAEVLDYILREMTDAEGGFYSSTDADSEGVEGKFFVWTPDEVRAVLKDEEAVRRICACYDITERGNWEHRSIPNRMRPIDSIAKELNLTSEELQETMRRVRPLLYEARKTRIPPGLDDKIITAWNGMMISAMAEAGRVLGNVGYVDAARRASEFLMRVHRTTDGRLIRTSRQGRAHLDAVLEDYAYFGEGLVDLYEACGEEGFLVAAEDLAERLIESFQDPDQGGFYTTSREHEKLILRGREGADGATPSGNAVAASLLSRLSFHFDRQDFREAAVKAVRAYGKQMTRYPRAFAKSLSVVDFLTDGPIEIALVGPQDEPGLQALTQAVSGVYLPNRIIALSSRPNGKIHHPLLAGKSEVEGKAALYICRNFTCQRPVTDPREASEALQSQLKLRSSVDRAAVLKGQQLIGFATGEGTARYAVRQVNDPRCNGTLVHGFRSLGATGLTTSKLGFGGYRIDASDPEFGAALAKALDEGVNLIDTSTNYMDGESERLVGSVIRDQIASGKLSREEIIVVSKIGYVQGQNLRQAEGREKAGRPYPEVVKYGDGIWHCIHPEFLADQLDASLDRLGLATLDVCLLHNPEYYLSKAVHQGGTNVAEERETFYRRIEQAFAYLESQISQGRLLWYGVSSNTVTSDSSDPESTSLSRMLEAASRAALTQGIRRHHFAVLQCPMNLFESGAWGTPNTGLEQKETVLQLARREQIAVLANRPLNAMPGRQQSLLRLAEIPLEGEAVDLEQQFRIVETLEEEYRKAIAPAVPYGGTGTKPDEFFKWASELSRVRPQIQGLEHWEQIEHQMIAPHVNQVLQAIPNLLRGAVAEQWEAWRDRYIPPLLVLLRGLRREATGKSRTRTGKVTASLDPHLPDSRRKESLSRKALWVVASTPGVTCVLNGMRSRAYVEDSLGILRWDDLTQVQLVYDAIKESCVI